MKKYIFLLPILPVIICQSLLAQSSYTLSIEKASESVAHCAIAATNNNEVIAVINRFGVENGVSELIRVDAGGNITDSLVFSSMPSRFYRIAQVGKSVHENTYFGLGWQWTGDSGDFRYLWLFEFDGDFNIRWEQIIDTIDYEPTFSLFSHWNNHYFIGIFLFETLQTFLYKVAEEGELLKKVSVPLPEEPVSGSSSPVLYIRQIPETPYFLMNRWNDDFYTAVMDDDLSYLYRIHPDIYPNRNPIMDFPLDLEFFNNTEFIRSGRIRKTANDYRTLLAVKKMDTASRNEAQIRRFGYEGWEKERGCYPGALKALAMHPCYFFAGGYAFRSFNTYPNDDNFIMAYAFSDDLDSLCATHIGNDAYYELYYVSPTPDGGCVLAASRYDWRKGDKKRNAFIAKLPKPDITSIPEQGNSKPFAAVYPNPGTDRIAVESSLPEFTVRLYNIHGQLVMEQKNRKELDTGSLPPGIYLYRISAADGTAASGKWVKSR